MIGAAFATLDWPRKLMTLSGAIDNAWVSLRPNPRATMRLYAESYCRVLGGCCFS